MAEPWAEALLAERRRTRDALIAKARAFVETLARGGDLLAAVVYGSVARGDFNVWSDVDLLLVLRSPRRKPGDSLAAAAASAPAGIQVVTWTPEEFIQAHRRGNPIAREALTVGEVLHGSDTLPSLLATDHGR